MPYSLLNFVRRNKESPMSRKRAPGGGRKPIGDRAKTAVFSTRLDPRLRQALDAAARRSGRSLSEEIGHRLRDSLTRSGRAERAPATAAFAFLIERLAAGIGLISRRAWHRDPWCFETF